MEDTQEFDGLLMTLIQKVKGIDNYFDAVFGFLFRKTDFFSNADRSKQTIEVQFKKYLGKFQDKLEREKKIRERKEKEEKALKQPTVESSAEVKEITPEEYLKGKKEQDEKMLKQEQLNKEYREEERRKEEEEKYKKEHNGEAPKPKEEKEDDSDKVKEGHVMPNKEKGQTLEHYSWGQMDIKQITIDVPLPKDINKKMLDIRWDKKKIYVGIKGQPAIIDGELFANIDVDSFIWTIDENKIGKMLNIEFEKLEQTWWESVIKGDNQIKVDTSKISPETSKLSDIEDPELKAQVEKMMFDTRQKQMGKPTSDILQKCPQIEDFMKKHPEMDFSHAKWG